MSQSNHVTALQGVSQKERGVHMRSEYVKYRCEGKSIYAAALAAGYSDGRHGYEIEKRDDVQKQMIANFVARAPQFKVLANRGKLGLEFVLDPENWKPTHEEVEGRRTIIPPAVKPSEIITAAKVVFDVLRSPGKGGTLADAADEEDEAAAKSLEDMATRLMEGAMRQYEITSGEQDDKPDEG